jgi:hypothetical protein
MTQRRIGFVKLVGCKESGQSTTKRGEEIDLVLCIEKLCKNENQDMEH